MEECCPRHYQLVGQNVQSASYLDILTEAQRLANRSGKPVTINFKHNIACRFCDWGGDWQFLRSIEPTPDKNAIPDERIKEIAKYAVDHKMSGEAYSALASVFTEKECCVLESERKRLQQRLYVEKSPFGNIWNVHYAENTDYYAVFENQEAADNYAKRVTEDLSRGDKLASALLFRTSVTGYKSTGFIRFSGKLIDKLGEAEL